MELSPQSGPSGEQPTQMETEETEASSHGSLNAGNFSREEELSSQMSSFPEAVTQNRELEERTMGELKEIKQQGPRARLAWALQDDGAVRLWSGNLCEQGRACLGSASQALLSLQQKTASVTANIDCLVKKKKFCLFLHNQYIALNKTAEESELQAAILKHEKVSGRVQQRQAKILNFFKAPWFLKTECVNIRSKV